MTERVSRRRLWLGVLLAPSAWVLTEGVGYYVAARSCEIGAAGLPLVGTTHPRLTQALISAVAFLIALTGLALALRNSRAVGGDAGPNDAAELGRMRFMSYGGVLLGILFAGGIVLFALPAFIVNPCSQAH
jgi:hypothetical protein